MERLEGRRVVGIGRAATNLVLLLGVFSLMSGPGPAEMQGPVSVKSQILLRSATAYGPPEDHCPASKEVTTRAPAKKRGVRIVMNRVRSISVLMSYVCSPRRHIRPSPMCQT